jgi:flavin-dependent dehydrogenase
MPKMGDFVMGTEEQTDVAIIGAGPAGSMAASMLRRSGWRVLVLERSRFPRFVIGESLLPQCMEWLEQAEMMPALQAAGFQPKRGAAFAAGASFDTIDFGDGHTPGWGWTWEVQRAQFDQIMAQEASRQGADVRFEQTVASADFSERGAPRLEVTDADGDSYCLQARFVCDASGAGRVLPKLLGLDRPSPEPPRAALFTHVEDRIGAPDYDRDMILLCYHPECVGVWYWLIPFSDGRASVGVVGDPEIVRADSSEPLETLRDLVGQEPRLARLLDNAVFDQPVGRATSYASSVSKLYGDDFALLGNAGGFIDPVFSSGVTLAMKSSVLAADLVDRQLGGQHTDWATEFEQPLHEGSEVFRAFVNAWYEGRLKSVFFKPDPDHEIRRMLSSILAGYVWDKTNPYVRKPHRRLDALCDFCAAAYPMTG